MTTEQPRCVICGEFIDRGACNTERGIFTEIVDTDETGTRTTRHNLCGGCTATVSLFILQEHNRIEAEDDRIRMEMLNDA